MTNALPYYPRYPRDFLDGTAGMSLELKGAYSVVLDLIYMMGERGLPDDARYISGQLGCSVRKWNGLRETLVSEGKIFIENGIISNSRADKEKIIQRKYRDNKSENRARPNKNKDLESRATTYKIDTDTYRDTNVSLSKRAKAERFPEFWDAYPHRGGAKKARADCEKRYARAVASGISEQSIISAAIRYASDRQVLDGYAKNPSTWLNQKGWEDEIEPTGPNNPSRNTGRSSPHDSLVAGFAAYADTDPGTGDAGFGSDGPADDTSGQGMDSGPGGYASQPILRLIGSN